MSGFSELNISSTVSTPEPISNGMKSWKIEAPTMSTNPTAMNILYSSAMRMMRINTWNPPPVLSASVIDALPAAGAVADAADTTVNRVSKLSKKLIDI